MKQVFGAIYRIIFAIALVACADISTTARADDVRATSAKAPLNIVIILVDDMGYGDVGPFNPKCPNRTPNIDRMAREGLRLTSFYAAPVCTPWRAQLLTGCYAKRVSLPQVMPVIRGSGVSRIDVLTVCINSEGDPIWVAF